MLNPFNPKYPVRPEFFANRQNEIERFRRDFKRTIDSKLPENIAILGDWGVGKSSLAYKFMDIGAKSNVKALSSGFGVPRTIKDVGEFCYLLLYKLNQDLITSKGISSRLKDELLLWRTDQLKLGPFTMQRNEKETPKIPITHLHSGLIDMWKSLHREGVEAVVLVVDDLHHLLQAVKGGILDVRSIFQDLPRYNCNYQLVITGYKALFSEIRELAEPMGRFFNTYEIKEFNKNEAKELINTPIRAAGLDIKVTEDASDFVYEKTKGNPYFVSFFMQMLVEERKKGVIDVQFIKDRVSKIMSELEREKFEKDMSIASEFERRVLKKMIDKQEIVRLKDLCTGKDKTKVAKALNRLVEKNLVVKVNRGEYKLYHPLFKEYLSSGRAK